MDTTVQQMAAWCNGWSPGVRQPGIVEECQRQDEVAAYESETPESALPAERLHADSAADHLDHYQSPDSDPAIMEAA